MADMTYQIPDCSFYYTSILGRFLAAGQSKFQFNSQFYCIVPSTIISIAFSCRGSLGAGGVTSSDAEGCRFKMSLSVIWVIMPPQNNIGFEPGMR